jgi:hypothetical protein
MDVLGLLLVTAEGHQYTFMEIDRSTCWAEAFPLKAVTAADCAGAFIAGWVSFFGPADSLLIGAYSFARQSLVILGLCSAPGEDSGISAAELVFDSPLQLPGQMLAATEQPSESFVRALNTSLP